VIVSGWAPLDEVPAMAAVFAALSELGPAPPPGPPPLGEPEAAMAELRDAGLREVGCAWSRHAFEAPDREAWYAQMERTLAPLALMRHRLGEAAWAPVGARLRAATLARLPEGPVRAEMPALLSFGVV
jgi:hypothetical protein